MTDQVEAASDMIRSVYPGAEVHEPGDGLAFSSSMGVVAAGGLMFVDVDQVASCSATMPVQDSYMVGGGTDSQFRVTTGRAQLNTRRPFLYPDAPVTARWEQEVHLQLMQLHRVAVEEVARHRSRSGRNDFRFIASAPTTAAAGRYWSSAVAHARRITGDEEAMANELIRHDLLHTMIGVLISVFPNTSWDWDSTSPDVPPAPSSVRRAIAYMDEHAAEPITLAQLADAARLTPRGLQNAFRRHLDTTPLAHLGRLRLDGARQDLIAADPTTGSSVTAVAHRWGFTHLSRFSSTYRAAFGESPRHTLDR